MGNPQLFNETRIGTKYLIEEYSEEVVKQLHFICDTDIEEFPLEAKFDFFYETRQAFGEFIVSLHCWCNMIACIRHASLSCLLLILSSGRSALLLSGGATLGMYHFGVIKALYEIDMLPRVLSGSSVGSIVASIICMFALLCIVFTFSIAIYADNELEELFEKRNWRLNAFESLGPGSLRRKVVRLFTKGEYSNKKEMRCNWC